MQEKDHSWLWFIARLTGLAVLLVAVATFISCFASIFWFADLFAHFRVQYCAVLILAAVVLLVLRCWKLVAVCLVCLLINGIPVWPYLLPLGNPSAVDADQPVYRILSLNLLTSNKQYDAVRNLILESQPDFVVLLETNERWEVALSPISERYPYSQFISQPGTSFRDSWAACDSIT
jgi:endonuclease/exonuclease/phosphatase (EEP) superfamily protein YafD